MVVSESDGRRQKLGNLKPGVNVYGYVYAESGVGEHTRLLVSALGEGGIDYAVVPFTETVSRQESKFDDFGSKDPDYDINIIGVNADSVPLFLERFGHSCLKDRYTIGLWAWELEEFPDWMAKSADFLDEVWANSSFSARSIACKICKPVQPFPLPIKTPDPPPRTRVELALPEDYLFMFCFDLDSLFARKNPIAVIEAFKMAFSSGEGPRLIVKSINGDRHAGQAESIREAAAGRPDIEYRDGYLPADDQKAFINACDAYVSLHRSEGFGLTMAEAMALGKPVIATAYSGNLDFMNENNSFLVPYDSTEIGPGSEPYPADAIWAEPELEAAARAMRRVYEDQDEALRRGRRAVRDVETFHSPAVRARFIVDRIQRVRIELQQRQSSPSPVAIAGAQTTSDRPGVSMEKIAELNALIGNIGGLIARGPDSDAHAALGGLGKLIRRLALRSVRNLSLYQTEVNSALLGAIGALAETQSGASVGASSKEVSIAAELRSTAQIMEGLATDCELRFEGIDDVARDLRLAAARLRGLVL